MDTENRLKVLEDEFQETKDELVQILYDIRSYIMEAHNPFKYRLNEQKLPSQIDSGKETE